MENNPKTVHEELSLKELAIIGQQRHVQLKQLRAERIQILLDHHFELEEDQGLGIQTYVLGYLSLDTPNLPYLAELKFWSLMDEAKEIHAYILTQEEKARNQDET